MCRYHNLRIQINCVKYLNFTTSWTSGIGQITNVTIGAKLAKSIRIYWCIPNRMNDFHIAYIMYIKTIFQADDQASAIQFNGENRVWVRVIADFCSLFKVTYLTKKMDLKVFFTGKIFEFTFSFLGAFNDTTATNELLKSLSTKQISSPWLL